MRGVTPRAVGLCLALCLSCSVGAGVGYARGPLNVSICHIATPRWSLDPTFYGGDWNAGAFTIYLQESGDTVEYTNQLVFLVDDTEYVAQHLHERLPVGPPGTAPVHATLGLNRACGRTAVTVRGENVALEAYAGYIIFDQIYRGSSTADSQDRLTNVPAFAIALRDPRPVSDYYDPNSINPVSHTASEGELEGSFEFYFARGRPAQRFP